MVRGHDSITKVHYKGEHEDFIIFVESASAVHDWRKDKSTPMAQVVDGYKIFVRFHTNKLHQLQLTNNTRSHTSKPFLQLAVRSRHKLTQERHGTQGVLDTASKGTLDTEFGTTKEDDVIAQILEKGDVQESEVVFDTRRNIKIVTDMVPGQGKGW